jgi:nucleotide-binding universal stress UspA family protein
MYHRILVALEHSSSDAFIIEHVQALARVCGSALVLIHVADGWVARNIAELDLRESKEMRDDRAYLDAIVTRLAGEGFAADAVLATGEPAAEIAAAAEREHCSLIAMSTHGHRFLADLWRGSVANEVRHRSLVPVLLVRAQPPAARNDACLPDEPNGSEESR